MISCKDASGGSDDADQPCFGVKGMVELDRQFIRSLGKKHLVGGAT